MTQYQLIEFGSACMCMGFALGLGLFMLIDIGVREVRRWMSETEGAEDREVWWRDE